VGASNLATRNKAIPFRAVAWGPMDLYSAFGDKDYGQLNGGLIRFVRPFAGQIITAKLTIIGTAPTGGTAQIRLYKGDFAADGVSKITSYTADRIAADHKAITGRDTPFSFTSGSPLLIDGVDLMRIITKEGDADYNEDGFMLGVEVTGVPNPTTYLYREFKLDCTAQMGVL
jgi:guanyl-specific ribonuclease Sa